MATRIYDKCIISVKKNNTKKTSDLDDMFNGALREILGGEFSSFSSAAALKERGNCCSLNRSAIDV